MSESQSTPSDQSAEPPGPKPVVVVAGASGYIGQALATQLRQRFRVIGLSRRRTGPCDEGIVDEWRRCDLYSLKDATDGLAGADYVVYLVHSMLPQDRLTQGRFADLDILLADNFARAARAAGAKQIIYLGGIVPKFAKLSAHLSSRREVEDVLRGAEVPLTILRAGLIVGSEGSSSQILGRLVRRLPVMVCPPWTRSQTQPIVLEDVIDLLTWATAEPRAHGQTFDLAGDDVMTYVDLIRKTAKALGKTPRIVRFPVGTPFMSALWVRLVTGAPLSLLRPLIESLRHDMTASNRTIWTLSERTPRRVEDALSGIGVEPRQTPAAFLRFARGKDQGVRSIQRLPRPPHLDGLAVAQAYLVWLPHFFRGFLRVDVDGAICRFRLFSGITLLELTLSDDRTSADRPLFYITGGILAAPAERARLEFREILSNDTIVSAIHEYRPRLWWPIYRLTQAPFHAFVMARFANHLAQLSHAATPAQGDAEVNNGR